MCGRPNPQRYLLTVAELGEPIPKCPRRLWMTKVSDVALVWAKKCDCWRACEVAGLGAIRLAVEVLAADRLMLGAWQTLLVQWGSNTTCSTAGSWMLICRARFRRDGLHRNRPRLLAYDVGRSRFDERVWATEAEGLLSDGRYKVGGTLIEVVTTLKSFRPKEGRHLQTTIWATQVWISAVCWNRDTPPARRGPRGAPAGQGVVQGGLAHVPGPCPVEDRNGLLMDLTVGTADRDAVLELLDGLQERAYRPRTLGTDRGYDSKDCVRDIRARRVTPHVARKKHLTIDGRTTRHTGYAVNLRLRKRVEVVFGWMKTVGDLQHTRYRGVDRTGWAGY